MSESKTVVVKRTEVDIIWDELPQRYKEKAMGYISRSIIALVEDVQKYRRALDDIARDSQAERWDSGQAIYETLRVHDIHLAELSDDPGWEV